MTPEQIELVRSSFARIKNISDTAAAIFYETLFELDPRLKVLFKGDIEGQGRRLMQMIEVAVKSLDRIDALIPSLKALGSRHVAYGVKAEDYETVGTAFIATLERGLGTAFTPEVKAAWISVYVLLASVMNEAATETIVG